MKLLCGPDVVVFLGELRNACFERQHSVFGWKFARSAMGISAGSRL